MNDAFKWIDWNIEHAQKHGVSMVEIESIVLNARRPYPKNIGNGKFAVYGRGNGGRFIEVMYIIDADTDRYFVIHAMPIKVRRGKR